MKIFIFYRVDTAQFWLMYIDMMKMQYQAHTAVQENNYDLQLHALQQFLPLYLNFNMHSYARRCAYYAEVLLQIDTLHAGLNFTLNLKDLSIHAQDPSGGIRNVASSPSSVLK